MKWYSCCQRAEIKDEYALARLPFVPRGLVRFTARFQRPSVSTGIRVNQSQGKRSIVFGGHLGRKSRRELWRSGTAASSSGSRCCGCEARRTSQPSVIQSFISGVCNADFPRFLRPESPTISSPQYRSSSAPTAPLCETEFDRTSEDREFCRSSAGVTAGGGG